VNSSSRGFTLLEMMTVVAIVGVLSALSVLSIEQLKYNGQTRSESRNLVTAIRNARTLAVTTGSVHGVYIGGAGDTWNPNLRNHMVVFARATNSPQTADYVVGDRLAIDQVLPYGTGVTDASLIFGDLEADPTRSIRIIFDGDGRPTVRVSNTSGSADVPFAVVGAVPDSRKIFNLRHRIKGPLAQNSTTRCVQLFEDGSPLVLYGDTAVPECG
jgi:prepilin-type N-terminal cleavage/methylation domain-containing protein